MKTRLVLQIVFCILSALSVASVFFLGAFLGWVYAWIGIVAAAIFGILMFWIKGSAPGGDSEELSDPKEKDEDEK